MVTRESCLTRIVCPLLKELADLQEWWTKSLNLQRPSSSVSEVTAKGHDGCIRCFLGFVWRYECLQDSKELCLGLLLNRELVESYVGFLEKVRQNKSRTIMDAVSSVIFAMKYLWRETIASSTLDVIKTFR
jgi:hypothetical protein